MTTYLTETNCPPEATRRERLCRAPPTGQRDPSNGSGSPMGSKGKTGGGGGGSSSSDFFPNEEQLAGFAQIPTSFGHELRACLRCRLVKTYDQFRESGCENCPFLEMDRDHDNVVNCTTPNFTGIISVMDPSRSWSARWLRIGRFIPGCYTLAVSEELPEEYQTICADNNVQYVPPKRS